MFGGSREMWNVRKQPPRWMTEEQVSELEGKFLIMKRDAHARWSHRRLSTLRRYELNSMAWGLWKHQKWHFDQPQGTSCPDAFRPQAMASRAFRDPSHNQALLAASQREKTQIPMHTPFILLPYKNNSGHFVVFCFSKMSVLVFPPHSAPFITGWCRQTYCSYFPLNRRGRNSTINLNESSKKKKKQ